MYASCYSNELTCDLAWRLMM